MTSLCILTKQYLGPDAYQTTTKEWDMDEAAEAWDTCERSVMKAYLYLVDRDAEETILVEAFE